MIHLDDLLSQDAHQLELYEDETDREYADKDAENHVVVAVHFLKELLNYH